MQPVIDATKWVTTALNALQRKFKVANESYLEETAFLDTVLSNDTSAWFASIDLNESKTAFKLDIGAEVTAISKITHQSLGNPQFAIPENG